MKNTRVFSFKRGSFDKLISNNTLWHDIPCLHVCLDLRTLILSESEASGSVTFEPGVFSGLKSLQFMDLSSCFCRRLPRDSFVELERLETLLLKQCFLQEMPVFGREVSDVTSENQTSSALLFRRKRSANLSGNATISPPTTIATDMHQTSAVVNTTVWYNPVLTKIDISYNKIAVTAVSSKFPPSLLELNLRKTSIKEIDDILFSTIPNVSS